MTGILLDNDTCDLEMKIRRDSSGLILSGLVTGDTGAQNQALIIYLRPGEIKESPVLGVGIDDALLDNDTLLYRHRIREHLESEGFTVTYLEIEQDGDDRFNININADY